MNVGNNISMDTAVPPRPDISDEAYQDYILQGVSRTFALTIPQLPATLSRVVGNAYLLCRIADTVEDDPDLPFPAKQDFSERFIRVVLGEEGAAPFARDLSGRLSALATGPERDLIANIPRVIRITHGFKQAERRAMARCIRIMAKGMVQYQGKETLDGLDDQPAMDHYCYFVAGVVGEMLTELFCEHTAALAPNKPTLMQYAVSFGQGLQMTNILKDIWEDRCRGACWLPREVFARHGVDLGRIAPGMNAAGFAAGLEQLIATAHGHLSNALTYTLLIPPSEQGIRRFCLWALGMAVLTLRKINRHRAFTSGNEVKISRRAVRATVLCTNLAVGSDRVLRALFELASRGLPHVSVTPPAPPAVP
jgi:farnesyl-diphosphate farnesyltransferase